MQTLIRALAGLISTLAVCGQGTIYFNTHIPWVVDARIYLPDGIGMGEGFTAQLFGGSAGTPSDLLQPLFSTTTFRTSSDAARGYVIPVDVTVPGVPPGGKARVVMHVYWTSSSSSYCDGVSGPMNITLGGGIVPPANLTGLNGFMYFGCIPEPSMVAIALLGLTLIVFWRPK